MDPRIQRYARLTRKVELGLRIPSITKENKLYIRTGYKTYFADDGLLGFYDTRIPITSTSSFKDFPASVIDKDMTDALNWTASAQYKIDPEFHDIIEKIIYFQDDKGKAQYYHDLNKYREYMVERGDSYERLKAMRWLRDKDAAFSNMPFLDHRGRIYERGLIGPQSGEAYRPFLNTAKSEPFSELGFLNLQDQIGAFLGGASDVLEHKFNSLAVQGRQSIAAYWRKDLVELGYAMRRGKPQDIRNLLENKLMQHIDGEEQAKLMRFALEAARIDEFLRNPAKSSVVRLSNDIPASLLKIAKADPEIGPYLLKPELYKAIMVGDKTVGTIRIDTKASGDWIGSLFIAPEFRGKNYAVEAVKAAIGDGPASTLIEPKNIASQKTFSKLGFKKDRVIEIDGDKLDVWIRAGSVSKTKGFDPYSSANLKSLQDYQISLSLEQDARHNWRL